MGVSSDSFGLLEIDPNSEALCDEAVDLIFMSDKSTLGGTTSDKDCVSSST